jgi:RNA-binding protein NOB1
MQNVLLQIGLRVVNMEGLVVKAVKQYVLKCHACFKICHDNTKLFCPACGNATLMRVSMYVNPDGTVGYSKGIKHFNLRGTKYSLPLPKQGRAKDDLVLREDQLLLSRHRRRPAPKTDADGFLTFSAAARGSAGGDAQEIIGMGFRCARPWHGLRRGGPWHGASREQGRETMGTQMRQTMPWRGTVGP